MNVRAEQGGGRLLGGWVGREEATWFGDVYPCSLFAGYNTDVLTDNMFCAKSNSTTSDPTDGDSGGPFVMQGRPYFAVVVDHPTAAAGYCGRRN